MKNLMKTIGVGTALVGALAGTAYADSDCKVSVGYQEQKKIVKLVDIGCDGSIDTGEEFNLNDGSEVKFAQDLEDPNKWIAIEKKGMPYDIAYGRTISKAPYQEKFDEIISRMKGGQK